VGNPAGIVYQVEESMSERDYYTAWILGLLYGVPFAIICLTYVVKAAIWAWELAKRWYQDMSDLVNAVFRR
jgi:predicted outer membrane lipoprotein